jgi:hypothetical protein
MLGLKQSQFAFWRLPAGTNSVCSPVTQQSLPRLRAGFIDHNRRFAACRTENYGFDSAFRSELLGEVAESHGWVAMWRGGNCG